MFYKNFPIIDYKFGNENSLTKFTTNNIYVDLFDNIKNDVNFYSTYYIQPGDRPDTLSYKIYQSPEFYWTFFLINDNLREQGWPMERLELREYTKEVYPNTVLTTQDQIFEQFAVGQTVDGLTSGETGTIIKKRYDFGQIIIDGEKSFLGTEIIQSTNASEEIETVTLTAAVPEYLSTHHYEDSDGPVDVDPFSGDPALYTPITYAEYYERECDSLRSIKVIKPSLISKFSSQFHKLVR